MAATHPDTHPAVASDPLSAPPAPRLVRGWRRRTRGQIVGVLLPATVAVPTLIR